MSTRANIIIKDNYHQIMFYRHSDGYPEGVAPTLSKFLELVKEGKIRNNAQQASGWLVILGASEYNVSRNYKGTDYGKPLHTPLDEYLPGKDSVSDWKVGAYEPATQLAGDAEFLYEIDLSAMTLTGWTFDGQNKGAIALQAK